MAKKGLDPQSSSALVWAAAIMAGIAVMSMNPALRFWLSLAAAVCAVLPAAAGSGRSKVWGLVVVVLSGLLAMGSYPAFVSHMKAYQERARAGARY